MPYRNAVSFNLEASAACTGGLGAIVGTLYFADARARRIAHSEPPLEFGTHQPRHGDPVKLLKQALQLQIERDGHNVSPESVIALEAFRLCFRTNHIGSKRSERDTSGFRLERLASIAVTHDADNRQTFRPLSGIQRTAAEQNHGITVARRYGLGGSVDAPVVTMHLTPDEDKSFMNETLEGIVAGPHFRSLNQRPFVLLHSSRGSLVEQIVAVDQLT